MAKIDRAQIEHVAKLASLSLTDHEAARMTAELGAILELVEELGAIDLAGVEPTATVQLGQTQWRDDAVAPGLSHDEALAQAPRAADGGFAVKTFVDARQPDARESAKGRAQ